MADVVRAVAEEAGATPAQVAIAWTLLNPAVVSPIIGARTLAQAEDNLGALAVRLSDDQRARLDAASRPAPSFPSRFMARPMVRQLVSGGAEIERREPLAA